MNRIVKLYNQITVPIFIIPNEEELIVFKNKFEALINTVTEIKDVRGHKVLTISYNLYNEALIKGLYLAEKENIKGFWFSDLDLMSIGSYPIRTYEFDILNLDVIYTSVEKNNKPKDYKKIIEKYFESIQKYLKEKLIIKVDVVSRKIKVYIVCNLEKYIENKNKFLDYEEKHSLDFLKPTNEKTIELFRKLT